MQRPFVAVVDPEPQAARGLATYLALRGYQATALAGAWELAASRSRRQPDVVVLDIAAAGGAGFDAFRRLAGRGVPVIALTAAGDTAAPALLLELGAADTMPQPADRRELTARIDRLLARSGRFHRRALRFETATADLTAARVFHDDGRIRPLSAGDVALLDVLSAAQGKVLSQQDIALAAPAADRDAPGRAVGARIARLRRKLETARIEARRGQGYRLVPAAADAPAPPA